MPKGQIATDHNKKSRDEGWKRWYLRPHGKYTLNIAVIDFYQDWMAYIRVINRFIVLILTFSF